MTPTKDDLWFLPLGGTGEIGMNLNLYGHHGQWLMVDCGLTFGNAEFDEATGQRLNSNTPDVQMANPAFIAERSDQLEGLIITHAHEDHIGAVQYLWPKLRCPIYTTRFTAAVLQRKLAEVGLAGDVPVHIIEPNNNPHCKIGHFDVEWVRLTHSIPEPYGLVIDTPVGKVFHTADWKLDPKPVVGEPYDEQRYRELGNENINAMVCDSTNATLQGHSLSEATLFSGLADLVAAAPQRVVVACFGSNVARLQTLARVAHATERRMGFIGRSMITMGSTARQCDVVDDHFQPIDASHLGYLPREEVLAVATGSQGEPRTALTRMAAGNHPHIDLEPGDTVIFSSKVIPGNEKEVEQLIEKLRAKQIDVVTADDSEKPIHASGHPAADELKQMYRWVKPDLAIPVHGEARHMAANAAIAKANGVRKQITGENGDLFFIAPYPGIRRKAAAVGRLGVERGKLVTVKQ